MCGSIFSSRGIDASFNATLSYSCALIDVVDGRTRRGGPIGIGSDQVATRLANPGAGRMGRCLRFFSWLIEVKVANFGAIRLPYYLRGR